MPGKEVAESWLISQGVDQPAERLAYSGGAPLHAMSDALGLGKELTEFHKLLMQGGATDPFVASGLTSRWSMSEFVNRLQKWIYDLISLQTAGSVRYHISLLQSLQPLVKRVDLNALLDFQRTLDQACRHASHPLNPDLQRESLMIQYSQMFTMNP